MVVRLFDQGKGGRPTYHGFRPGVPPEPRDPIQLTFDRGGDDVLAVAFQCRGIVLSHDCEIENAPDHVIVAPILPWENLASEHQTEAADGDRRDVFPLLAQHDPTIAKSYVKFARISVIHRDVLGGCARVASGTEDLRKRLTVAFFYYLIHPEDS